jgi:hypothetical protein
MAAKQPAAANDRDDPIDDNTLKFVRSTATALLFCVVSKVQYPAYQESTNSEITA